jgi:hypothetical protein
MVIIMEPNCRVSVVGLNLTCQILTNGMLSQLSYSASGVVSVTREHLNVETRSETMLWLVRSLGDEVNAEQR